jgi:hypothetical protein
MTAVAVAAALGRLTGRRRVASGQELLRGSARSTLSNTESRLRLDDLVEALDRELPAVADLAVRLAIDLEVHQDIITQACSSPARFHQPLLEVPLCLLQPGRPQLAAKVEPYIRANGTKVWSVMQLERQLQPEAYRRRRGSYRDHRRTRSADASRP